MSETLLLSSCGTVENGNSKMTQLHLHLATLEAENIIILGHLNPTFRTPACCGAPVKKFYPRKPNMALRGFLNPLPEYSMSVTEITAEE